MSKRRSDPVERFWKMVDVGNSKECWPWKGCVDEMGYGRFVWTANPWKRIRSHRFAYTVGVGRIPNGLCVCHHCDNKRCCNPAHLFIGTREDNILDMVSKARQRGAAGRRNAHYGLKCLERGCIVHMKAPRPKAKGESMDCRYCGNTLYVEEVKGWGPHFVHKTAREQRECKTVRGRIHRQIRKAASVQK